jgi:hypothetical protein
MKPARTQGGAELYATLTGENVAGPPERRISGIGLTEITFGLGFVAAFVGVALVSVAAALVIGGFGLCLLSWRLA